MTLTPSEIKILLVEDDAPKRKAIEQFLNEQYPNAAICITGSLTSAITAIEEHSFHIAIIDMSIPTYEFALDKEGGGQPEGFGGAEILRFIESESPKTISVVITQYQEFSDKSLGKVRRIEELTQELTSEFPEHLYGVLRYTSQRGLWRDELKAMLVKILEDKDK